MLATVSSEDLASLRHPSARQQLQRELQRVNQEEHQQDNRLQQQYPAYLHQRQYNLQRGQYDDTRRWNEESGDFINDYQRNIDTPNIYPQGSVNQQMYQPYDQQSRHMNEDVSNYKRQMEVKDIFRRRNQPVGRIQEAFNSQMYQEHRSDEVVAKGIQGRETEFVDKFLLSLQPDNVESKRRYVRSLGRPRQTAEIIGEF